MHFICKWLVSFFYDLSLSTAQPHTTHVKPHRIYAHMCVVCTKESERRPQNEQKKKKSKCTAHAYTVASSVKRKTILGWNPFWLHIVDEKPELTRKKMQNDNNNSKVEDKIGDWLLQIPSGFYYFASLRAQTSAVSGETTQRPACWLLPYRTSHV